MKKWWTDPKDFDKLSFCVYAAEIRGEEERPYVLIPAAQWEELGRLVKHSVMLGESPLGSIAKNSREYPNSIEAVMKLVLQIGGAEDGNESKE